MSNPNFRTCPTTFLLSDQPLLVASIDGTLPLRSHARTLFRQAPTRAVNIVAPGILYISKTYIELMVGDINDQFRHFFTCRGAHVELIIISHRAAPSRPG
jgi:hypothetical protein